MEFGAEIDGTEDFFQVKQTKTTKMLKCPLCQAIHMAFVFMKCIEKVQVDYLILTLMPVDRNTIIVVWIRRGNLSRYIKS